MCVCLNLCRRLCRCYSIHVKLLTHLLYVQVCECACAQLWKTVRCHGNTGQSILGSRFLGRNREGALFATREFLLFGTVLFTHVLESFRVSPFYLLVYIYCILAAAELNSIYLLSLKCYIAEKYNE